MEKGALAAPPNVPEAPPSYEEAYAETSGKVKPNLYPDVGGAPPPAAAGAAGAQQPAQIVVQYVTAPNFGPESVRMTCPQCLSQIQTATVSEPGPMAWIIAGILCIVGLWPCACIPCCVEQLNSVTHKCPNCKTFLGRYKGGM